MKKNYTLDDDDEDDEDDDDDDDDSIYVYLCKRCGKVVGNIEKHDAYHAKEGSK